MTFLNRRFKIFVGVPIPDPSRDPAFRKYRDAPKFRDAVKTLKQNKD